MVLILPSPYSPHGALSVCPPRARFEDQFPLEEHGEGVLNANTQRRWLGVKMFAIEDAKAEIRLRPKAVMAVSNLCPHMIMTIITTTRLFRPIRRCEPRHWSRCWWKKAW